jgi:hypothetical protein
MGIWSPDSIPSARSHVTVGKLDTFIFSQADPAKLIEILSAVTGVDRAKSKLS